MRASRLLSIVLLLQTRGRLTAAELADELEVSVRTIYRDIDSLQAARVPVYGDAGLGGGYQLVEGYQTRLTGLTTEEAEALVFAGMPGPAAELGLGTVVAAAHLKLMAALPDDLRDRAARIEERFHLDAPGWYQGGDDVPHLAAVADAVWNQHRVRVRYHRWREPFDVTRTLEPYGLVLKGGRWYVVARAVGRRGDDNVRTYRINQIRRLQPLDVPFERPADFDLVTHWNSHLDEFRAGLYQGEATVRLSPQGRERLRELMSADVINAATRTESEPGPDGWTTSVVPIESLTHAEAEFLKLGANVKVLEPVELRDRMTSTVMALRQLYTP